MADKPEFTWKNWWYYHKWWVVLGLVLAVSLGHLVYQNLTRVEPDYQAAYVGDYPLDEDTAAHLEALLAELGRDLNGDGRVTVRLNQYPTFEKMDDAEAAAGRTGSQVRLMGDLLENQSHFFLLQDPEGFQRQYDVLEPARLDAGVLSQDLSGLTLAYRGYEPDKTPDDLPAYVELWQDLSARQISSTFQRGA